MVGDTGTGCEVYIGVHQSIFVLSLCLMSEIRTMARGLPAIWVALVYIQVALGHMNLICLPGRRRSWAALSMAYNIISVFLKILLAVSATCYKRLDHTCYFFTLDSLVYPIYCWVIASESFFLFCICSHGRTFQKIHNQLNAYLIRIQQEYANAESYSFKKKCLSVLPLVVTTIMMLVSWTVGFLKVLKVRHVYAMFTFPLLSVFDRGQETLVESISLILMATEALALLGIWFNVLFLACIVFYISQEFYRINRYSSKHI